MIDHRPFASLGGADHGWLRARHHFSFASYYDPARMGWGALRVWNDDWIAAGAGFPPHPHRDMEIITYVRAGAISHRDSLGHEGRTVAGDVQVMSAGTGITHAEYNAESGPTEIFQIWIEPQRTSLPPRWDGRAFPARAPGEGLAVLASGLGDPGALEIMADARLLAGMLAPGDRVEVALTPGAKAYLVPARGSVTVNGLTLAPRDGAAIADEATLTLVGLGDEPAELLLVETLA